MNETTNLLTPENIRALSQRNQAYALIVILLEWLIIVSTIYISEKMAHPLSYTVAIFIVGSRMYALYSLLHDGLHYLLFNNRNINDWVCRLFLAWPIFISLPTIRKKHLAHHRFLQTENDPEYGHKKYSEFQFPKSASALVWILFKDIVGYNFLYYTFLTYSQKITPKKGQKKAHSKTPTSIIDGIFRWIYYASILCCLFFFKLGIPLLLFWIIPYCTVFQALNRIRLSTEHFFVNEQTTYKTRTVRLPFWERWILSPHNLGFHTEHHLFPGVPFYKLPTLHLQLMKTDTYEKNALISRSYFSVLLSYIKQ